MDTVFIKTQYQDDTVGQDHEYRPQSWHASFACKVKFRPGGDWFNMRWGFNAGVLLEEALDRARLFVESQHSSEIDLNRREGDQRTLSLRCRVKPNNGLVFAIMGKVSASTEAEAQQNTKIYCREICSIFPQDFVIEPAKSLEEYKEISGSDILQVQREIAQVKRYEKYLPAKEGMQYVHGLWQSSARSHEQIWRALANLPEPTLFSISLRPITIYPFERQLFEQQVKSIDIPEIDERMLPISYKTWSEIFINRRIKPLQKYFYLQIHLASLSQLDENIFRCIGTALTRANSNDPLPGFKIVRPIQGKREKWAEYLDRVDLTPSESEYNPQHLSDISDLEEAASVFRYPYPHPDAGIPGVNLEIAPIHFNKTEEAQG